MLYKQFHDLNLSTLGMGNMRLPKTGKGEEIDEPKALELIDYAYKHGVNYFDTAYRYHDGASENFIGKALQQYPRDTWYLATKLPGFMMRKVNDNWEFTGLLANHAGKSPAEVFQHQLEKCGVDYFDFYLLHNLCESSYDFYTDDDLGIVAYLLEEKRAGRIRHLGFSAHGRAETIDKFLNWSKEQFTARFDFVQIQLNYLDWKLQEAGKKYEVITNHGIPIMVMEPCRGGRLVSLGEQSDAMLRKVRPNDSIASWAFRFLQSLPNVQVVLSGMTTMEQLRENVDLFSKEDPISSAEKQILDEAVKPLLNLVPCTACRYCCEACPQNLDIPKLISLYNEAKDADNFTWMQIGFTLNAMKEPELPAACLSCGECAKLCPQGITIPDVMKKFADLLEARTKK